MLEWYEAFADYSDGAARLEALVADVAETVLGTTQIERDGASIDLAPPWRRITLTDAIAEATGLDLGARPSREELAAAVDRKPQEGEGWGKLVDAVLSKRVEPELSQPTFLLDYPVELSPFAKRHRDDERLTERWEAFCGGIEIANAFSELNDPDEQRRRFEQQAEEQRAGDDEAQPFDEGYIQALELGMPPTSGVGLGIDRLVMILTGASSLREVVLFPAMRN
jgi:lysyl-tRNA synthetase class 2